jgi:hypothetical protein
MNLGVDSIPDFHDMLSLLNSLDLHKGKYETRWQGLASRSCVSVLALVLFVSVPRAV